MNTMKYVALCCSLIVSQAHATDITTGAHVTGAPAISSQGAWLQWNRNNGDGATWLLNQKGGGGGGIMLGESDTSNNVTSSGTFTPSLATLPGGLNVAGALNSPRALPVYNLLNYGADPTGAVDMCAAGGPIQTILAAATGLGFTIYAPGGRGAGYLCNEQIAVSGKSFALIGDGKDNSIIQFGTTNAGISVVEPSTGNGVRFQGLTLRTKINQSSASALTVSYNTVNVGPTVSIHDVEIDGSSNDAFNWHLGLDCHNCAHGSVTDINFRGRDESNPPGGLSTSNMFAGVHLTGRSTDLSFDGRCIVTFTQYGFYASGDSEGQHYSGCTALADNYGWYLDDSTSGDAAATLQAPGPRSRTATATATSHAFTPRGGRRSSSRITFFTRGRNPPRIGPASISRTASTRSMAPRPSSEQSTVMHTATACSAMPT